MRAMPVALAAPGSQQEIAGDPFGLSMPEFISVVCGVGVAAGAQYRVIGQRRIFQQLEWTSSDHFRRRAHRCDTNAGGREELRAITRSEPYRQY